MKAFSTLLDRLYYTSGNLAKAELVMAYLREVPDPDRGWAIAAMAGTLSFDLFKRHLIKQLMVERTDPYLFDLSYDYVGEMSETVAHLWPVSEQKTRLNRLPSLSEVVERFQNANKEEARAYLIDLLDNMDARQRWALVKLGTRGLRIGISARFVKKILADYGDVSVEEIERLWHGLDPPYTELLLWLDGIAPKPDVSKALTFHPVMLSHPLDEAELTSITPEHWQAEWKYDGIRVQLVSTPEGKALFSRTGDDISQSFPDLIGSFHGEAVLDGELLVMHGETVGSFNELQQRLNKKAPSKKRMQHYPVGLIAYDALSLDGADITSHTLLDRREKLSEWLSTHQSPRIVLSSLVSFESPDELMTLRDSTHRYGERSETQRGHPEDWTATAALPPRRSDNHYIEGLMLKRKDSPYIPGRPKGRWVKFKREAMRVDAVLMYAQRGHGKRSSFYSDYTFGLWEGEQLLPIGKAYSGFTDEELKQLDKWVRNNTIGRFGPVREVTKELILEIAFDSVHASPRHKSGLALRFPRIHRIRWDKPAHEVQPLSELKQLI